MRLLAISVVILAGAVAAGAGVVAEAYYEAADAAFPRTGFHGHFETSLDAFGMWLAGIGLVLFIVEWWSSRKLRNEK